MEPKHYLAFSLIVTVLYGLLCTIFPKFRRISLSQFDGHVAKVIGIVILVFIGLIFLSDVFAEQRGISQKRDLSV